MWRSSYTLFKQAITPSVIRTNPTPFQWKKTSFIKSNNTLRACLFSSSVDSIGGLGEKEKDNSNGITFSEAKKLMKLVNVEALKMKLSTEGKETICYLELLEACESMGVTKSIEEAKDFVKVLDEAGVVLIFRDKVYLHPDKVFSLHCYACLFVCFDLQYCWVLLIHGMLGMQCFVNTSKTH